MNYTKTVLIPIKVPNSGYCWEPHYPHRICGHFDNEGGHPTCGLNLGMLKYRDDGGVEKPAACACLAISCVRETKGGGGECFRLAFEGYSRPADTFPNDHEWAVYMHTKLTRIFEILQKECANSSTLDAKGGGGE